MFNKKLKRSIKEIGKEITAMRIVNATIQMMYKLYEREIKKIKENFTKLELRVDIIKRSINTMEARNLEERIEKLEKVSSELIKKTDDIEKENGELRDENKQTVSLVKELLEKLGYEYKMVSNDDYMKAYKVTLTKDERNNIERSKGKSK